VEIVAAEILAVLPEDEGLARRALRHAEHERFALLASQPPKKRALRVVPPPQQASGA
jgi:hypothetical protein